MTTTAHASGSPKSPAFGRAVRFGAAGTLFLVIFLLLRSVHTGLDTFPEAWNIHLDVPIDNVESWVIGHRNSHPLFVFFFDPVSDLIDLMLRAVEDFLLALPWPAVVLGISATAYATAGRGAALLAGGGLLFMGMVGLWTESMQTLALMGVSVSLALLIGIPLGILSARWPRLEKALRPILDAMQTMPAFVYLIPVLLFFGVARVPSVVATVIYALPPAIRMTSLGIRQAPKEVVEAADACGCTSWQKLIKVQLPLAMPSILVGINQTIMMALGIVVIAALIGAGGLGREVLLSLQRLRVGQALEAGLAIVLMAIILDRISHGYSRKQRRAASRLPEARQGAEERTNRRRYYYWTAVTLALVVVFGVHFFIVDLSTFPAALHLSIRQPVDAAVRWMRDNLYQIGDLPIGAGPLSDFLTISLLNPLRSLFQEWLPWPLVILAVALIAYFSSGWRLGIMSAVGMFALGLLGLWTDSMDTLSQVLIAVLLSVSIAVPVGILAARSDRFDLLLRPVLDFLQTIPVFVYLVPVIMLFNVGRVPGVIASVLYALPPAIRLTNLGIRHVPRAAVEAADVFGATPLQKLVKVELPLARPSIMMGINQTVMMVLAMVVIAGLVGGGALGFEAVNGLAKSELGRGMEAGLAIVLLAVVMDRITQAWARGGRSET